MGRTAVLLPGAAAHVHLPVRRTVRLRVRTVSGDIRALAVARKLRHPEWIETVRGIGFRFEPPRAQPTE